MFHSRVLKISLIIIVIFATVGVANALAASNTIDPTRAGDGNTTISGYHVTNIQYHLDAFSTANIASVSFTLDNAANNVIIWLNGTQSTCTVTGGTSVSCPVTGVTVTAANSLRVVAGDVVVP